MVGVFFFFSMKDRSYLGNDLDFRVDKFFFIDRVWFGSNGMTLSFVE